MPFKRSGCLELFRYSPKCNPHAKTPAPVALEDWFCKPLTKCLLDIEWKVNKTDSCLSVPSLGPEQASSFAYCQHLGEISSSLDWHHVCRNWHRNTYCRVGLHFHVCCFFLIYFYQMHPVLPWNSNSKTAKTMDIEYKSKNALSFTKDRRINNFIKDHFCSPLQHNPLQDWFIWSTLEFLKKHQLLSYGQEVEVHFEGLPFQAGNVFGTSTCMKPWLSNSS